LGKDDHGKKVNLPLEGDDSAEVELLPPKMEDIFRLLLFFLKKKRGRAGEASGVLARD
jgi:hypothetical protein